MATFRIGAVSPGVPAEDMTTQPEGGVDAASLALRSLFPDRSFGFHHSGTLAEFGPGQRDTCFVATFGATVVVFGDYADDLLSAPGRDGRGVYVFAYQSTSMATAIEVNTDTVDRLLWIAPGTAGGDGDPLPFEADLWDGQNHPEPPPGAEDDFDERLASAAARWMFGYDPQGRSGDGDRVRPDEVAVHAFELLLLPV